MGTCQKKSEDQKIPTNFASNLSKFESAVYDSKLPNPYSSAANNSTNNTKSSAPTKTSTTKQQLKIYLKIFWKKPAEVLISIKDTDLTLKQLRSSIGLSSTYNFHSQQQKNHILNESQVKIKEIMCEQNKKILIKVYPKGIKFKNGTYEGKLKQEKKHGYGIFYYDNGSVYQGLWYNDHRHEYGIFTSQNGNRYQGMWKNGKKHGKAKVIKNDGKITQAIFQKDHLKKVLKVQASNQ